MKASTPATKLYLAGLALLALALLVFVQAAFNLGPFNISPTAPGEILLLYTLSTFIFLVLILFGFVLLRSLFKLWVEHKREKPGAKFKTRLVLSMIGLTLVPATFLFLFSFGLVNRSMVKWFSVPVDTIFQITEEIDSEFTAEHEIAARGILAEISIQPPDDFESAKRNFRLEAIALMDPEGRFVRQSENAGQYRELFARLMNVALQEENPALTTLEGLLVGAQRIASDGDVQFMVAVFHTPEHFQSLTTAIAAERLGYIELVQNQRLYRDTYVYILVLMTILVLFAAVWTGLYLSKRITIPIEALSGATREISAGNLGYRVQVQADDELGMLVGLFNDMATQLQFTTEELETRRRYTEIILEAIPTGVISIDDDFRVTKMNRAARTMFSIEAAQTLNDIFTREDLEQIAELLRVSQQEETLTRELTLSAHEGPVHCAVTASVLRAGGFVLVVEDLTEVVKAQKATAWREVARRLAHEIKNPLTPIQLSAERIARNVQRIPTTDPQIVAVIQECVDGIIGEVGSLKALVNEFARVARLPAISRQPAEMKSLVEMTLALYEDRFNGTAVRSMVPDDLPPVLMDSQQIKRVLINLIDNALEAMAGKTDKELTIGCELVRDRTMARLTVTDTGRGINQEDRSRLFAPYFSTRKNGTGLGLAISSRIVADHGGYIGSEPNTPHGAKFVVELPVCQES
jgi:two-component system nitrogen regulation sensor histidine kinase NtrY